MFTPTSSEADLLRSYPSLTAADMANAWAFVLRYRAEIDVQIRGNRAMDVWRDARGHGMELMGRKGPMKTDGRRGQDHS